MPVYTELLYPTRSENRRGIRWAPCPVGCPCAGVVEILSGKKGTRYAVTEVYVAPGYGSGRAFKLTKAGGVESYDVFVSADRTHGTCTCAGFTYAAAEKADRRHGDRFKTLGCRHLDALDALLENSWLPDPRANPEADTGPTEADDQELPECFRGLPALPVPGCPF